MINVIVPIDMISLLENGFIRSNNTTEQGNVVGKFATLVEIVLLQSIQELQTILFRFQFVYHAVKTFSRPIQFERNSSR